MSVLDNALQALFSMAHKEILWENASPTSSFAAQTTDLNLSEYDAIEIEAGKMTTSLVVNSFKISKSDNYDVLNLQFLYGANSKIYGYYRPVEVRISENKLIFNAGYITSDSQDAQNNISCIPLRVFGMKL